MDLTDLDLEVRVERLLNKKAPGGSYYGHIGLINEERDALVKDFLGWLSLSKGSVSGKAARELILLF
jgi:hypothetical protein